MQRVKTNAQRSLSLLLVLALILSLCAMPIGTAYADDAPDLTIGSIEELQAFADAVDNGETYEGKTVVLTADIDASNVTWNPIGEKADNKSFKGTFDGQGHTVTLSINSASGYNGLFCYNFGTIKNVKIAGSIETTAKNAMYNGAVCAQNKSGGVVDSCINEAVCTYAGGYSAGVVGQNAGTVSNCVNRGSISVGGTMGGAITCGGTVTNCLNIGTLSGKAYNISYSGTVTNSYYLDTSSSPSLTRFYGVAKTEAELKAPEFAATLGDSFAADANGGFPVLKWEAEGDAPHVHSYTAAVTAPTCTEAGFTTYTCSCGDTYTEAGEPALGHVFEFGMVESNGDDTHTGYCSRCEAEDATEACSFREGYCTVCEGEHVHGSNVSYENENEYIHKINCSVCGYSTTKRHDSLDFVYTAIGDDTHTKACGADCGYSVVEACTYENNVCVNCGAEKAVPIPTCSVAVALEGTGNINTKFNVPLGQTLDITWKFIYKEDVPYGWAMVINGVEPTIKFAQSVYESDTYTYDEAAIAPIKIEYLASMMALYNTGVPASYSFTPTQEQCEAGETVKDTIATNEIPREDLEFELVFVNKDTNEVIGSYYGDDGTGYHAKSLYGEQTIASKDVKLYNWFGQHYPGYRLYRGTLGNYDQQNITIVVDQNGVVQKKVEMLAEVNHGSKTYHSQNVKFMDGDTVVLETAVPLKNGYVDDYTAIELDLSAASDKLAQLGYEFDGSVTYTVKCNNYTHDPEVTVIEVSKTAQTVPYEYTIEDGKVTITKYLGNEAEVVIPAEIDGKAVVAIGANAFAKNEAIVSVTLPTSVGSIGQSAFAMCTKLENINVENVTSFGAYAFFQCASLKEIAFNDSIETLPVYLFSECTSLASVKLPASLKALSNHLFDACESLKSVDIPNGVTIIDRSAFENAGIETIVIPDSVIEIGDYAFENAPLTTVTFGKNVEKLGSLVFWGCDRLTEIVIPEKVTAIPYGTFFKCTSLTKVVIGRNVATIDETAFNNTDNVTIYGYPETAACEFAKANNNVGFECIEHKYVNNICVGCGKKDCTHFLLPNFTDDNGDGTHTGWCDTCEKYVTAAHSYDEDGFCVNCYAEHPHELVYKIVDKDKHEVSCTGCERIKVEYHKFVDGTCVCGYSKAEVEIPFEYVVENGEVTLTKYIGDAAEVVIPDSIDGNPVVAIGDECFFWNKTITKVTLNNGLRSIGDKAFMNCWALENIELVDSLESIGKDAFAFCKAFTAVVIPDSVKTIGDEAFYNCDELKTVTIGTGLAELGSRVFDSNLKLEAINVAADNANFCSVDGVLMSKDKTELIQYPIGASADTYIVPEGVEIIGEYAFAHCKLNTVVIPDSVLAVEEGAFFYSDIVNVDFGKNVVSIGNKAFEQCGKLRDVTFPETLVSIGDAAFYECRSLTEVIIPDSVKTIGKYAFQCCTGVKTVVIGYGIETIGNGAFCGKNFGEDNQMHIETFTVYNKTVALDIFTFDFSTSILLRGFKGSTLEKLAGDLMKFEAIDCEVYGHSYGEWKQTKAPTCTAKGSESRTCTRCNVSETRDIASLGHDLKHHEAKAATCTEKGWAAYDTCSRCDYSTYKEIATLGHKYTTAVTTPTCTAKGYTTHTCTACGNSYKDSYTNALGHDYKSGKCTRCGAADASYVAVPALKITTASGHPKLSWNAVDGAYKYWIYRSTDGKNFKYYDRTNNTSYTNNATTIGTTYYYKVKAVKAVDGKDVASDYSVVKSIQCRPAAVNISIYRVNGKPQLKWSAVDGATKYWIYRSTDGVNFKYYDSTTKTSYTNTGAASGTKYYYKVKAVAVVNGTNVASAYSNSKSLLTTLAAPSVSITTANGKPKVTWKAVTGADKYYVYRSTDGKNFSYWDNTTNLSYTNLSANKGTKYFYKVKAVSTENSNANSAQSSSVSITATK